MTCPAQQMTSRALGIPADIEQAAQVVAKGRPHRTDLGEANGHPFFNIASIGFGVDLTGASTTVGSTFTALTSRVFGVCC